MESEVIVEEGIVISIGTGTANVAITRNENCEECSAKILCKPKSESENVIKAEDPFGVKPGDKVKIELEGSALLSASFFLYGIPLILLLTGIFLGMSIFSNYSGKELYSFLFGIGLVAIFYFLKFFNVTEVKQKLPRIISVNRNN